MVQGGKNTAYFLPSILQYNPEKHDFVSLNIDLFKSPDILFTVYLAVKVTLIALFCYTAF